MIDRRLSGLCPQGVKNVKKKQVVYKGLTRKELGPTQLKANLICRKSQNAGELREKAAISSIKFHVNCFQWGWIIRFEYVIKCKLFTRRWHVIEHSLMWTSGI